MSIEDLLRAVGTDGTVHVSLLRDGKFRVVVNDDTRCLSRDGEHADIEQAAYLAFAAWQRCIEEEAELR